VAKREHHHVVHLVTELHRPGHPQYQDGPKRAKAAREMAKKIGVDIKQVYLTSGESDLLVLAETPNGDNIAKLALAIGSQGNVRSRTARAWTEEEYAKLVSELP
jgi:uncharacterized protein with GYD domain